MTTTAISPRSVALPSFLHLSLSLSFLPSPFSFALSPPSPAPPSLPPSLQRDSAFVTLPRRTSGRTRTDERRSGEAVMGEEGRTENGLLRFAAAAAVCCSDRRYLRRTSRSRPRDSVGQGPFKNVLNGSLKKDWRYTTQADAWFSSDFFQATSLKHHHHSPFLVCKP